MQSIYQRVDELVEQNKSNMKMGDVFTSLIYRDFIRQKARNIITGTFYHLRKEGFNASPAIEARTVARLTVDVQYQPQSDLTAYAQDNTMDKQVVLNAGNKLVADQPSRQEQHLAVLGMLYHELGHVLFTDYPTMRWWLTELARGAWFPEEPKELQSPEGCVTANLLADKDVRELLVECAHDIQNRLEDGYVEREVCLMCPGMGQSALSVLNLALIEEMPSLGGEKNPDQESDDLFEILNQVLMYAKFGEIKVADDYNGPLLDAVYACIDIIDDYRGQRDPKKRVSGVNALMCVLGPYIEQAIKNQMQKQQKQQNQQPQQNQQSKQSQQSQQNQNGQQGQPANNGQPSQQGQPSSNGQTGPNGQQNQNGQSGQNGQLNQAGQGGQNSQNGQTGQTGQNAEEKKKAVAAVLKRIQDIASHGASAENKDCTSTAVNKPTQESNDKQPINAQSPMGGGGAGSNPSDDKSVATLEVDSIVKSLAKEQAEQKVEGERTRALNREAATLDMSQYGLGRSKVVVKRASTVPQDNVEAYNRAKPNIQSLSKSMQRGIKRVLKERRQGGVQKNLPFGRRLEVTSIVHDDGKYFSRKKAPTLPPQLAVGLLVDESGSTSGKLINAARTASLVIEDFCRELDIPHLIYGYSTGALPDEAEIFSYCEPQDIDNKNRYRITGMTARGGTPTATALAYMHKRLHSLQADVRLLIVITDGVSQDNYSCNGVSAITRIIRDCEKNKTVVIAAGIGINRSQVEYEFGTNFMDISDVNTMPANLVALIKKNIRL